MRNEVAHLRRILRRWRWANSLVLSIIIWACSLCGLAAVGYGAIMISHEEASRLAWQIVGLCCGGAALVAMALILKDANERVTLQLWPTLVQLAIRELKTDGLVVVRGGVTSVVDAPAALPGRLPGGTAAYWMRESCDEGGYVIERGVGRFTLRCGHSEVLVEGSGGEVLVVAPPGWRSTSSHAVAYEFETERQVAIVGSEVLVVGYLTGSANAGGYRSGPAVLRAHGRDRVLVAILHGAEPVADLPVSEGPIWRYGPR